MTRTANTIAWGILGCTAAFIVWVLWAVLWPFQPMISHLNPLPILNPGRVVRAGETLLVGQKFTKTTDAPSRTSRLLKNGMVYNLPDIVIQRPAGDYAFTSGMTTIPEEMKPGIYTLEYVLSYDVNPLRTINYRIETEQFRVVASCYGVEAQQEQILNRLAKVEKLEKSEKHKVVK
jgi:hypothetical protein